MHLRGADRIEIMQQLRTDGLGSELGLTVETDPDQATTLEAGQLRKMVVLLVEILENFLARNADQLALQTERPGVIHTSQFQDGTTLAVVQKTGAAVRARNEKRDRESVGEGRSVTVR